MTNTSTAFEVRLQEWRDAMASRPGVNDDDVDELTDHLLGHVEQLTAKGLTEDEALLIAAQRVGRQDQVAEDYAHEHYDRFWKQLVTTKARKSSDALGGVVVTVLAVAAGLIAYLAMQIGSKVDENHIMPAVAVFYSGTGLVTLAAFAAQKRQQSSAAFAACASVIVAVGAMIAFAPWRIDIWDYSDTLTHAYLHAPILLAVVLGVAYVGTRWREVRAWSDYIRFVGEQFVYFTLVMLGLGVLLSTSSALFILLDLESDWLYTDLAPFLAGAGFIVAAWLVNAKKSVVENLAPVLTAIFTPLFAVMLTGFGIAMAVKGANGSDDTDVLGIVDATLIVVSALVLFTISNRGEAPRRRWDILLAWLVLAAMVVDTIVLTGVLLRIGELGLTINRFALLGINIVLLVHLVGTVWFYIRWLRGTALWSKPENWQVYSLWLMGAWAAVGTFVFPMAFQFT